MRPWRTHWGTLRARKSGGGVSSRTGLACYCIATAILFSVVCLLYWGIYFPCCEFGFRFVTVWPTTTLFPTRVSIVVSLSPFKVSELARRFGTLIDFQISSTADYLHRHIRPRTRRICEALGYHGPLS